MRKFKVCSEGIDGCGKSAQIWLLKERLRKSGFSAAVIKHPGGTPLGAALRGILLAGLPRTDVAARLLFLADAVEASTSARRFCRAGLPDGSPAFGFCSTVQRQARCGLDGRRGVVVGVVPKEQRLRANAGKRPGNRSASVDVESWREESFPVLCVRCVFYHPWLGRCARKEVRRSVRGCSDFVLLVEDAGVEGKEGPNGT